MLNACEQSCIMMIMEGSKMFKTEYDLKAIMHPAYYTPHKLCNIRVNENIQHPRIPRTAREWMKTHVSVQMPPAWLKWSTGSPMHFQHDNKIPWEPFLHYPHVNEIPWELFLHYQHHNEIPWEPFLYYQHDNEIPWEPFLHYQHDNEIPWEPFLHYQHDNEIPWGPFLYH